MKCRGGDTWPSREGGEEVKVSEGKNRAWWTSLLLALFVELLRRLLEKYGPAE
jgi:hypothetical protein